MASDAALFWSFLHVLTKERYDAVREVYGSLEGARKHCGEEFLRSLGCRQDTVMKALLRAEEFDAKRYRDALAQRQIQFLDIADAEYPDHLREIGDPPPFLYAKGALSLLRGPCVGLVGTRRMSPYGKRVVEAIVPGLVASGVVTVSGLAEGIDAAVAEETLRDGGKTVAVLGHGLGMVYPSKHQRLAAKIVDEGGLLLSEFPLDHEPEKFTFPARNRLIAGLSLGTAVLEAPAGSGAIITAELALEYGREVFVVPGQIFDPNYEGSHALLAKNAAQIITQSADILRAIGVVERGPEAEATFVPCAPEEKAVYEVLTRMPMDMDALVARLQMEPSAINAALTMMELSGGVKNVGGGLWVRA